MSERVIDGIAVREWGDPDAPGILLWPGLGSAGFYFAAVADLLPGRAVAVDPPGFGSSARPRSFDLERLVEQASALCEARGCVAVVGHSLGASVAVGVAADPPPNLRAAVAIDGGFMTRADLAEIGMPADAGHAALTAWMATNIPRFPDWQTAIAELAAMLGSEVAPVIETYARAYLVETADGITEGAPAELLADVVLAMVTEEPPAARGARITLPTLLIACGLPSASRGTRERAWQAFAQSSPLIDVRVAEDWGHNPVLADPSGAARLIGDWLAART
ncbi:MAG TPA: alpha/beta hydrolase [Solirubrobacteraceae bacterium]|nr:alpha/beta hydrolase [Solirubrobacteraceae bacterium]